MQRIQAKLFTRLWNNARKNGDMRRKTVEQLNRELFQDELKVLLDRIAVSLEQISDDLNTLAESDYRRELRRQ
jgi:hypothetical protein